MAVRNESVRLTLDDSGFTTGMAKAAAATALLDKSLNDLDGSNVNAGRSTAALGQTAIPGLERSARKAGPEIDRLSGRMRLFADAALTLGPAMLPLGAAVVPALGAMAVGMTAAAGAAGVAALALVGVGDALGALNDYQLEPTAENLQAMRLEMEKLGPDGAHFVAFLSSLEPTLRELQMTARAGFLPGVEEGISELLTALPQINALVGDLASTMGTLAADAGASLAGDDFRNFFDYLATDAAPTLDALTRSIGNFGEGFANIIVGFAPATRDFTGGLQEMSERFAEWSRGLEQNDSFQGFVDYVRESGPMAVEAVAALGKAFAGIAQAAAPLGQAVLPVLTQLFEAIAKIASSDIGGPLFTGIAAMAAFSRASSTVSATLDILSGSLDRTGGKFSTGLKVGGAVAGLAVLNEAMRSLGNTIETADLERNLEAFARGADVADFEGMGGQIYEVASSLETMTDPLKEIPTLFGLLGDTPLDQAQDDVEKLDQALAQMVEAGDADKAAAIFDRLIEAAVESGVDADEAARQFGSYKTAVANAGEASADAAGGVRELSVAQRAAQQSARDFSAALAELNGWLDKREALRNYAQGLEDLAAGFKDGFTREDAANLDAVGRSITQVASQIKDKGLRADFLASARESLVKMADNAGPKAEAAIRNLVKAMDRFGLTKPKAPDLDVDSREAERKLERLEGKLDDYGLTKKNATAALDDLASGKIKSVQGLIDKYGMSRPQARALLNDQASGAIGAVQRLLNSLDGQTATTYIKTVRSISTFVYGSANPAGSADGGTVPRTGLPYADRHPYLLADGEEVISNRYGQADRHRELLKAINAGRLADGGTVGRLANGGTARGIGPSSQLFGIDRAFLSINELAGRIDNLSQRQLRTLGDDIEHLGKRGLGKLSKSLERASQMSDKGWEQAKERLGEEKGLLKDLRDARRQFAEEVSSNFRSDIFGGLDVAQMATDGRLGSAFSRGLNEFVAKNLDTLGSADGAARQEAYLASLSPAEIAKLQAAGSVRTLQFDSRNAQAFEDVLKQLSKMGLKGGAFNELATSGNLAQAQAFASMGSDFVGTLMNSYGGRDAELRDLGQYAGNVRYAADIREQTREVRQARRVAEEQRDELRLIKQAQREANQRLNAIERAAKKAADDGPKETGKEVGKAIKNEVTHGQRSGK